MRHERPLSKTQQCTEDAMLVYWRALVIPAASPEATSSKIAPPHLLAKSSAAQPDGSGDHVTKEDTNPGDLASKAMQAAIAESSGCQERATPDTLAAIPSMDTA